MLVGGGGTWRKVHLSANSPRVRHLQQRSMRRCMLVLVGTFAGLSAPCCSSRPRSITWIGRSSDCWRRYFRKLLDGARFNTGTSCRCSFYAYALGLIVVGRFIHIISTS